MNHLLKLPKSAKPKPMPESYIGRVTGVEEGQNTWRIDQLFLAKAAESLLVKVEIGDVVAFIEYQHNLIIVQILQREGDRKTTIQSHNDVCWIAPKMSFQTQDELELLALNRISITADHLMQSAQGTSIQQAQKMILSAQSVSASADDVMNLTAKQHMLIAEEEVRIDGERINMG
ncbi:DUF3540 domain-containing protein [Vibrio gazogenes]|uniref:DUF3540 domain-containing protein n=1 Tax=Vibrio gazogenes DSM 21264 = NBRC 103151 TaxID=1123492 RepID=A0A1M4TH33_VIBGA|nr:DUF3540 domain-containing protein [Vibrio gazogenes]USP16095.1 DUF3540 domain-containing protein [Vibrio gazogenes]SHE43780.1 Protein of unknown function [Vibrio gazogenes DSM 21264] [Vibrio gazogenes DSM 21264 = NBRC 103151]SJN54223.1 hypothetical protein BQ6471_00887 [Vibrio gazogenes]